MKKQHQWILTLIFSLLAGLAMGTPADNRPNILWITIEDWCPDLSCYGTKGIQTPHVDQLAAEGIRYEYAFTTAPVCSASRSAMMTGFHQNYIGASQHRTPGNDKKPLPYGIKPISNLLAEAGYFTCLMSKKIDCNFVPSGHDDLFMGHDWKERQPGQPFFARITLSGTHRSWKRDPVRPIAIKDIELPPYYPDTPFVRRDWANGLEQMQLVDRETGDLLQRLEDEGLAGNTIVIFIADHGRCHIRGKQFLYDGGIRIPMIVRWPGHIKPGQVNQSLVSSLDLCATSLEVAGVTPPVPLHGASLFSQEVKTRKYVFAARDKMDETHDSMRAIRSHDFKLIQNLMPERPYLQYNFYKEGHYPMLAEMAVMYAKGTLTPAQAAFFAPTKPEVELYDLRTDPHETKNLAGNSKYASIKKELLTELNKWRKSINDHGVSADFRADGIFPKTCTTKTVQEWVESNGKKYDFKTNGWPAWYPTRDLADWQRIRDQWEPYVFRTPAAKAKKPAGFTKSWKKKKK
ncbi:sulfatase family protein [Pontiella sulfatireligans]|uniref:Arylsulfatase n=1 Tax=Pontiella sulfatireligans TaxID=2750658 RepID=A0A6C2UUC6_9BACT|nr:sulfatase [Pontiella sulfatireligans]SPS74539.1 sulfatase S1_8 [Kiritimatiellales bacterium]VGO22951.1 Arylsulfatase [Pontiella sulfatireligans]